MDTKAKSLQKIISFSVPKYKVRVWLREDVAYEHKPVGFTEVEFIGHRNQDLSMREFVEKILAVQEVASVECLDWGLCGMIVHR